MKQARAVLKLAPGRKKGVCRKGWGAPHQAQEVEEEVGMLANEVVGLAAKVNKIMEAAGRLVTPVDDIRHVRGEDKRGTVPGPRGTYRQKVNVEEEAHLVGCMGGGLPHPKCEPGQMGSHSLSLPLP